MSHQLLILCFSEKTNCQDYRKCPDNFLGRICYFSLKKSQTAIWYLTHANDIV